MQKLARLRPRCWVAALVVLACLAPEAPAHVTGQAGIPPPAPSFPNVSITGAKKKWQFITFTFSTGISGVSETSTPNPFLDYRLIVTFTHWNSGYQVFVPGFYAADGDAADYVFPATQGADAGDKWRAMWTPEKQGAWVWEVSFRQGNGTDKIAINPGITGTAAGTGIDGAWGWFNVGAPPATAQGFFAKGALRYVDEHYLQFAQTGEYFLKSGVGSPENFLGYYEFDNTPGSLNCGSSPFLHDYSTHGVEWNINDAADLAHTWGAADKGINILGAINYLGVTEHVNSLYMLTFSGQSTNLHPWRSTSDFTRFDVSKLAQWDRVFTHMTTRGVQQELVLEENENDTNLGSGTISDNRKLYYREIIARFAHHHAIQWVVGEESSHCPDVKSEYADYIHELDPYKHPIAIHSFFPCNIKGGLAHCTSMPQYGQFCGSGTGYWPPAEVQYSPNYLSPNIEAASLQVAPLKSRRDTEDIYDSQTALSSKKWVFFADEVAAFHLLNSANQTKNRKALWGNLVGGGSGVAWYAGTGGCESPEENTLNDDRLENFHLLTFYWDTVDLAFGFFRDHVLQPPLNAPTDPALQLPELTPKQTLASPSVDEDGVLAKEGQTYVVYRGAGDTLDGDTFVTFSVAGTYRIDWFDPRNGGSLITGNPSSVTISATPLPQTVSIGKRPNNPGLEWVALVRRL